MYCPGAWPPRRLPLPASCGRGASAALAPAERAGAQRPARAGAVELSVERQSLVSYHLGQLRAEGLVSTRRSSADGRDVYYRLDLDRCRELLAGRRGALHPGLGCRARRGGGRAPGARALPVHRQQRALADGRGAGRARCRRRGRGRQRGQPPASRCTRAPCACCAPRGIDLDRPALQAPRRVRAATLRPVVTLCDRVREVCPEFPGRRPIHWSVPIRPDPRRRSRPRRSTRTPTSSTTRIRFLVEAIEPRAGRRQPVSATERSRSSSASGAASAASASAARRRTSRCCASCASSAAAGSRPDDFEDAIAACNLLPGPGLDAAGDLLRLAAARPAGGARRRARFIVPGLVAHPRARRRSSSRRSPPLWVRGAGAGAGAAVAAVAVQAGWSLVPRELAARVRGEPRGAGSLYVARRRGRRRDARPVAGARPARLRLRRADPAPAARRPRPPAIAAARAGACRQRRAAVARLGRASRSARSPTAAAS